LRFDRVGEAPRNIRVVREVGRFLTEARCRPHYDGGDNAKHPTKAVHDGASLQVEEPWVRAARVRSYEWPTLTSDFRASTADAGTLTDQVRDNLAVVPNVRNEPIAWVVIGVRKLRPIRKLRLLRAAP
jgi:hypothetical protein